MVAAAMAELPPLLYKIIRQKQRERGSRAGGGWALAFRISLCRISLRDTEVSGGDGVHSVCVCVCVI